MNDYKKFQTKNKIKKLKPAIIGTGGFALIGVLAWYFWSVIACNGEDCPNRWLHFWYVWLSGDTAKTWFILILSGVLILIAVMAIYYLINMGKDE